MLMKDSKDSKDVAVIEAHRIRIEELKIETGPKYDSDNSKFIKELERRINTWQALKLKE